MTKSGDTEETKGALSRRRLLVGGGMLAAYAGLGALAWRSGALRMLTEVGEGELDGARSGRTGSLETAAFAAMGTYLTVTSPKGSGPAAVRTAVEAVVDVERRMSAFLPDSELTRLNAARAGDAVVLSQPLASVLEEAARAHRLTQGAFDPTVPPLLSAWGFCRGAPTCRPGPSAVRAALAHTGMGRVTVDGQTARYNQEGMTVDLGGIAKGYGVDRAAAALSAAGVRGLVNSGGDIRAAGARPGGEPWRVGVRDPVRRDRTFATISLTAGGAIATSGTYEQYVELEGKRIPHVLDPRSGQPVDEMVSATVIAPTAMEADALATACVVLGRAEALALLEPLPGVEGLLVARRGPGRHVIDATAGLAARILYAV